MGKQTKIWTGTQWVDAGGPPGPTGPTGPAGQTGPTGPAGPGGGGGSVAAAWSPGSNYPVGQIVHHKGRLWRLKTAEPGNGFATRAEVVAWAQQEGTATGQTITPPSSITSVAVGGDMLVLAMMGNSNNWGASFTMTNLTLVDEATIAPGSGTTGARLAYSFWNPAAPPSVATGVGWGRYTWLLVRGATEVGLTSRVVKQSYVASAEQPVLFPACQPGDLVLGQLAMVFSSNTDARLNVFSFGTDLKMRRAGDTWSHPSGSFGDRHAACHYANASATGTFSFQWTPWTGTAATPSNNSWAAVVWNIPANPGGCVYFNEDVWVPLDVSPGVGDAISVNTYGLQAPYVMLPKEDRTYTFDLTKAFCRSSDPVGVTFPIPSDPSTKHTIRCIYSVTPYSADQFAMPRRAYHFGIDVAQQGAAQFDHKGVIVEPGDAPGAKSVIDLEWDPLNQSWSVCGWSGDARVRSYVVDTTGRGNYSSDNLIRVLYSPEVQRDPQFSEILTRHTNALDALPPTTKRVLASVGQYCEVVSGTTEGWKEAIYHRGLADAHYAGWANLTGLYAMQHVMVRNTGHVIPGFVLLHELGHAWDFNYFPGTNRPNGINPAGTWWEGNYYPVGTEGAISSEQGFVDLYARVTDKPGLYYRSSRTEWAAQVLGLIWADHITGYDSTIASARDSAIVAVVNSDMTLWNDTITYLRSIGAVPSSW